jgi:metallophosphoesterase (TIGR00282 family)
MEFSLLYFGDVVGEIGLEALADALPGLKDEFKPDLILVNLENVSQGKGVKIREYQKLLSLGIDAFSGGDHMWRFDEISDLLDKPDTMIARPANFPNSPGRGYLDLTVMGKRVRLISLMGRVFMHAQIDSPFSKLDAILAEGPKPDVVIVDFHAEATSEKRALAEYGAERVQLQVGTHTHVPTADAQILSSGTGFITDLGMCGPTDSSLGADKQEALKGFLTGRPWRYTLAAGQCELGAIFAKISFDEKRTTHIEHVRRFV